MSDQGRMTSLIEVCINTGIGFVVSAAAWPFVAWWMGYPYTLTHTLSVTTFYTVLSVARGYVVRRFFAQGLHRVAANTARRWAHAGNR
jgi:phosphate/sulfate permease